MEKEKFHRRLSDAAVLSFGLLCAVLVIVSQEDRHSIPYRIFMCLCPSLTILTASFLLRRYPYSRLLWILRYTAPLFFLTFFFRLTGQITPFFPLGHFDALINNLDTLLFGEAQISMNFQHMRFFSSPLFG